MAYKGPERRSHPRITARFIVSYRVLKDDECLDMSQTKNLSLGGMRLATNKPFPEGAQLEVEIRLPFDPDPVTLTAKVLESHEVTEGLIYDTRLSFLSLDERHKKTIIKTINYYLKRSKTV